MTNREYMIALLDDPNCIDDGGASYEKMVHNYINCPYGLGEEGGHCIGITEYPARSRCFNCIEEWLDQEVDE